MKNVKKINSRVMKQWEIKTKTERMYEDNKEDREGGAKATLMVILENLRCSLCNLIIWNM